MSLVTMECDRCGGQTTHKSLVGSADDYTTVRESPYDGSKKLYYCRACERGKSKGDLPEDGLDANVGVTVSTDVDLLLDPDDIEDDETLQEYVERRIKNDEVDRIAETLVDGISKGQISLGAVTANDPGEDEREYWVP